MRIAILALAALLVAPASALASGPKPVPPSNSAANQYVETVPTAGGGRPATGITSHSGSGSAGAPAAVLPPQTQTALRSSGRDGQRVAALAAATAPARPSAPATAHHRRSVAGAPGGGSRGGGSGGGGSGGANSGGASGNTVAAAPVSAVVKSLTGGAGSGIGAALPVALAVLAVGISAVALLRRHAL